MTQPARHAAGGAHFASIQRMLRVLSVLAVAVMTLSCSSEPRSVEAASVATTAGTSDGEHEHAVTPHGDHTPHHGGTVYMKGDLHFEVVLDRGGTHRIYFSDATRAELPAATASEVTLTFSGGAANGAVPAETLTAQVDESGESWIAAGSALKGGDVTARVAFVVDNEPYWIDVPYVEPGGTGPASLDADRAKH